MGKPPLSSFDQRLQSELASLAAQSQLRKLQILPELNFCSNDYLGLSHDPRLSRVIADTLAAGSAVGATGSRLLSGNAAVWEVLESELAAFSGAPAALYFNSGYAANVGILGCVAGPEDVVFSDSANHASIIDGIRLSGARKVIFPHLRMDSLEDALRQCDARARQKLIVVESVFSMDGDLASLSDLMSLAERFGALLIVDEAHATGVWGPKGRGWSQVGGPVLATVHTCGKALAGAGAFVCCSATLKQYLINRARTFIFSTALPPYIAAQISAAIRIAAKADAERSHLARLADSLRSRLQAEGFDTRGSNSQIVPVILGSNEQAMEFAQRVNDAGFAVRAIRPPTVPPGTARLRLSLHAGMTVGLLEKLADVLVEVRAQIPEAVCNTER